MRKILPNPAKSNFCIVKFRKKIKKKASFCKNLLDVPPPYGMIPRPAFREFQEETS